MATFLKLWNMRHSVDADLARSIRLAEINKDRELRAAITIQSHRRGMYARRRIKTMLKSCVSIQRIWRSFLARQYACHISMLRDKRRAHALWTRMATVIQKTLRGFYSRRYKHSYYERQAYLASVTIKEEKIRELSDQVAESTHYAREQVRMETEKGEFDKLAKDLHHLMSTSNTPGVFNSPYNIEPVRAFGAPVETHLKASFARSKYLQRHMTRALGQQRYRATKGASFKDTGKSLGSSGSYTHSSAPRPLEPLVEEEGPRTAKRHNGPSHAA